MGQVSRSYRIRLTSPQSLAVAGGGFRRLAYLLAGMVAALAAGWLIAHGDVKYLVLVTAIAAAIVATYMAPAPFGALLLLVILNGVPIVDLSRRLPGGLKVQDAAVFALGVLLVAYQDRAPRAERARIIRIAMIWGGCFVAWWTITVARSVLLDGIPWLKAMLFGRDFLYFAILLPLALQARFPARSLRQAGLLLLALTIAYGIGQAVESVSGISLSWLVHPEHAINASGVTFGLTRVYSTMSYIANTVLIFAAALFLSRQAKGFRWLVGGLVALFIVSAGVQFGRANYFALAIAVLVAFGFYAARHGMVNFLPRAALVVAFLIVVVLALAGMRGTSSIPVANSVLSRANSGVSALLHSTGTVGYREQVDQQMLHVLGSSWPIGLGFLPPSAHYVSSLPVGSIRNNDTGVFNALMTMGIVGVLLLYAPLAYGMLELIGASGRSRGPSPPFPPWILYAGAAWIAWAIAGSVSLVLLFSVPGLVVTALALAALAHVLTEGRADRAEPVVTSTI